MDVVRTAISHLGAEDLTRMTPRPGPVHDRTARASAQNFLHMLLGGGNRRSARSSSRCILNGFNARRRSPPGGDLDPTDIYAR